MRLLNLGLLITETKFYNYIYLDPTKPGKFSYPGLYLSLLYEPFYVGKGSGNRYMSHLTYEFHKKGILWISDIHRISRCGYNPSDYILKLNRTNLEPIAYSTEEFLIRKIGRQKDRGPLYNKMFKPSNSHQSDFMKEFNPMFSISHERHSKNIKDKQWAGVKGLSVSILRSWSNKGPIIRTSVKDTSWKTFPSKRKLLGWSIFDISKLKYKDKNDLL